MQTPSMILSARSPLPEQVKEEKQELMIKFLKRQWRTEKRTDISDGSPCEQPATNNQQLTTNNQQPATNNQIWIYYDLLQQGQWMTAKAHSSGGCCTTANPLWPINSRRSKSRHATART